MSERYIHFNKESKTGSVSDRYKLIDLLLKQHMDITHNVIVVPGLGDKPDGIQIKLINMAVSRWKKHGVNPKVHIIGWEEENVNLRTKLNNLISTIDDLNKSGIPTSLVGISAGGSAVMNAFLERRESIHRVINLYGRLLIGNKFGYRSLENQSKGSKLFFDSVNLFYRDKELITSEDGRKIMTIRAIWGLDELVPPSTTKLNGVKNIESYPTHLLGISLNLFFSSKIIKFIKG